MDLVIASCILQYTPVPHKYIRVSRTWKQCILDVEDEILHRIHVYGIENDKTLYNVLAIRNQWSIIYRLVTQENRNEILHLCLTFKQFHMFWFIYRKWNYDSKDHRLQLYITWSLMQGKRIRAANRLLNNVSKDMIGSYKLYLTDNCMRYLVFKSQRCVSWIIKHELSYKSNNYITRQEIVNELNAPFLNGRMSFFANSVSYTLFNEERHSSDLLLYYHHCRIKPAYHLIGLKIRNALGIIPEKYIDDTIPILPSFEDVQ